MNRFQRFGPHFQYYNPYYNNYYRPPVPVSQHISHNKVQDINTNDNNIENDNRSKSKSNDDTVWLDLFGIKLYFDDVLILSLLFFLYKEEVKDEGLFLALVLLLIS